MIKELYINRNELEEKELFIRKNRIIDEALLKNVSGGGAPGRESCTIKPDCQPACGCGPDICNPQGPFCISTPP